MKMMVETYDLELIDDEQVTFLKQFCLKLFEVIIHIICSISWGELSSVANLHGGYWIERRRQGV
jgi:hypothetical protein